MNSATIANNRTYSKMNGSKPFIALALLTVFLIAAEASEAKESTKIDKQPIAKKKLQQAKTAEVTAAKIRLTRDVASSGLGDSGSKVLFIGKDKMLALTSSLSRRTGQGMDLMSAAGEKKYMLVKKKPKHKKIKMEVFKPKMKYKKIKMKIPVKKMKKKKVKGYLVKKEHGHHGHHEY